MTGQILTANDIGRLSVLPTTYAATNDKIPIYDTSAGTLRYATTDQIVGGASEQTDYQQFIGINDVLAISAGTWTVTRVAQGNYVYRHTAADNTGIIGVDITPVIRTTASKGFKLTSIDFIYSIATLALDAHTATLDLITYANNAAATVTSVPLTGSLATATQANPYATNLTVTSPAYDNTALTKYVLEQTVNNSATSAYDWYGINLKFSRTN